METYKGKINEFVDWITGENVVTKENETDGLSVSGGSIRDLLQTRLREPFVLKEDLENNLYRMFSSEDSYQLWLENPSDNADLELFNFVRPSDYKLTFTINSSNKFVRYGDSTNLGTRIQYSWDIRNDEGESSDSLSATYTISTANGKETTFTRWYNKGDNVDFSIYEYLEPGINTITIQGKGSTTGARNSVTYNIILLQLNIASSFDFTSKRSSQDQITIPCVFTRNNQDGTAKIYFQFDDQQPTVVDVLKNTGTQVNATQRLVPNLTPGQHVLQIWAEALYNDGSVTIVSNLLYYTFVIATSDVSVRKYICVSESFDSGSYPFTNLVLNATLYMPQTLKWGYYTDAEQTDTQISVEWKLYQNEDDPNPETLSTVTANTREQASDLQYVPAIYSEYDGSNNPLTFLSAVWNNTELIRIPILILQNTDISVHETGQYAFKLSAYGKTNDSPTKNSWVDTVGGVETTFTGISWDPNSGWYKNSFRTVGTNEYATIDYAPFTGFDFSTGKTIEIEFETEKVTNDDDKLVVIGTPGRARIEITPTKASLYSNGNVEIVHTNYKANERLKLAFILNEIPQNPEERTVESGLAYIVNNGILERAASAGGAVFNTQGTIKIGGSNSGVRVYNMRIYNYAITYTDEYENYVYDSDNKISIVNNNNVLDASSEISFDLCKNKLDTILISGDLSKILSGSTNKEDSTTDVTIERYCPYDATKNFKINNVQIRKHGQSTLNYPITSMKFWLNKSKSGVQPIFEITPQEKQSFNKNRYRMKDTSIPQNKFVLQANYADSSGVHNGGLERLIQTSWFNAKIDNEYKLRTLPQLFSTSQTVSHTDASLHDQSEVVDGPNTAGKLWRDYSNSEFPYDIRVSPDSFPCAVFYYDEAGTQTRTFLGQYVFMDDKKSDFLYGERSIYKVPSDPFCLTTTHASDDKKANKVWDNGDVLRIEVLESNNQYSSYMSNEGFTDIVDIVDETTGTVTGRRYAWEGSFELIYPDPDDIEEDDTKAGTDKFDPNSEFVKKVTPFINWYNWLISTRNNQQKFEEEAAQHLDLYKMAAYYVCLLRFGLVDSLERNAQIKTYDGVHFHYEPWDMDIALGNKNDGGIAYNPPIDRNTKLPGSITTYAYSGRSANAQGEIITSNWLFDALEAWPYWMNTIVPKVADALFNAGLSYDNISNMFDNAYMNAWCETIYNKSGFFKYIESGKGDPVWLSWLQGSRMTHRHWWLSTSMDYYDAKWFCGDYKNHYIYITANVPENSGEQITIVPNKATYMTVAKNYQPEATRSVSPADPLVYTVPALNTKVPFLVYGANFMESIDLSGIATGLDAIDVNGVYSSVLGSPLKELNIGVPVEQSGSSYTATIAQLGGDIKASADSVQNLQTLNIRGQRNFENIRDLVYGYNLAELQNVYAMGSGLTNFYSSESGNKFANIELPSSVSLIELNNTTWNSLEFWDTTINGSQGTFTPHSTVISGGTSNVPADLQTLKLKGTSCQSYNSLQLVRDWLNSIVAEEGAEGLHEHYFEADKIYWTASSVGGELNLLTYDELSLIAQLNGDIDPETGRRNHQLKGYIVLKNEDDTPLTTEQLSQIKSWFGDSVFTKNSSGLVIDHMLDYVQINLGGDVYVENNEFYVKEGKRISLSATKFALAEPGEAGQEGMWTVSYASVDDPQYSSSGLTDRGITIIDGRESADGITYLQTSESIEGGTYDIKIWYTALGQSSYVIIHVLGVTYPVGLQLATHDAGAYHSKQNGNNITISQNNTAVEICTNEQLLQYTAKILTIRYSISNGESTLIYDTASGATIGQFADLRLVVAPGTWTDNTGGIATGTPALRVECQNGTPADMTIYDYTITANLIFVSGKTVTVNGSISLMKDPVVVLSTQAVLWSTINTRWQEKYSENAPNQIKRSDLIQLDGSLTFPSNLINLQSAEGDTVLNYLVAIQSLTFDGNTNLTTYYTHPISHETILQMDFTNTTQLLTLSIQNCTGLTGTIDLSGLLHITQVDASGTTVNVSIPSGAALTKYELGTPTSISISNPTVLQPSGVIVDDNTSLTSLELINIPGNKTFTMFGKIMGIS